MESKLLTKPLFFLTLNIIYLYIYTVYLFLTHRVKLAVNQRSKEAVAVKIVDLRRSSSVEKSIRKEVSIHIGMYICSTITALLLV